MPVTPVGAATPATSAATVPGHAKLTFKAKSSPSTIVEVTYRAASGASVAVTPGTSTKQVQVNPSGTTVEHEVEFAAAGGTLSDMFIVEATITEGGAFQFTRRWSIDVVRSAHKMAAAAATRARRATAKKATAKRTAAKKTTARKATAKKSVVKTAAPKKRSTAKTPRAAKPRKAG